MIYTVTLNPSIDYVVEVNELTAGEIMRTKAEDLIFGGKGINVSSMLAQLGMKSCALGFIAGFTGDALEQGVAAMGIQGSGIRVCVDARQEALMSTLVYHPFLIKPNHKELAEMFEVELSSREDLLVYAKELQAMGARNVLVSMAEQGALLLTETQEVYHAPACRGKVVNSVGAGDSMVAGFLYGYLREQSYAAALRYGTACGSASAFSKGIADRKTVEELLVQLKEREAC